MKKLENQIDSDQDKRKKKLTQYENLNNLNSFVQKSVEKNVE